MDHLLWFPLITWMLLVQENLALTEEQVSRIVVIVFANVFVLVFANVSVFVFIVVFVCHI